MPIMNLGQIASTATTFAGGRLDWALSEVSLYVNVAFSEIKSRQGIRHTPIDGIAISSTTSGENRIALPPDWDYPLALSCLAGSASTATASHTTEVTVLVPKDQTWMDAQTLAIGVPEAYCYYGTFLELYPSPNSAYSLQLRYVTKLPTLVASTDTPLLDEKWHWAGMLKTAELLEASRNNVEGESIARNRYLNYVTTTMQDQAGKQQDRTGMTLRFGSRTRQE
jgi:hypothetical protein